VRISRITHNLTYVPIHITLRFNEAEMGVGTAFFYTAGNKDYLITNWHNVSGRRPWDKKVNSERGAIPDNLVVRIPYDEQLQDGVIARKWLPKVLKLYADEEHYRPIWWEHPNHRFTIDAVAIELAELATTKAVPANAESLALDKLSLTPGMDVFVLGYPRGISGGGRFPLWKRGSIASEPDVNIDNLPKMYIDTATREGMSGAPVYAQEVGFWAPEGKKFPDEGLFGKGHRFIGIYSGRVGNDPFLAQLGIVWKEEAIQEIIAAAHPGTSSFQLS
jgi:hypothetical protein